MKKFLVVVLVFLALLVAGCCADGDTVCQQQKEAANTAVDAAKAANTFVNGVQDATTLAVQRRLLADHPNPTKVEDIGSTLDLKNNWPELDPDEARAFEATVGFFCLLSGDCVP